MTIKQQGGIFGRNPTFKDVEAEDLVVTDNIQVDSDIRIGPANSSQGQIELAKGSGAFMRFRRIDDVVVTGNNIGGMEFYTEDENSAGVGAIIKGVAGGNGGQVDLQFHTGTGGSTANAMTIEDGGDVIVETGNLVIGTSGKGIDFSATSGSGTSELFDDYEEGLHTSSLTPSTSGSISLVSGYETLSYTKVGQIVSVQGRLRVSSVSSPVGDVQISLPFAAANLSANAGSASGSALVTGGISLPANSVGIGTQLLEGNSYCRVMFVVDGGNWTSLDAANLGVDDTILIGITYVTA